ncbi:MAG: hypothetical protein OZ948_13240 [Deltaproteobacteria bacterium]|nr:hypothetical protein [Deltaproteobacteria bacterium]
MTVICAWCQRQISRLSPQAADRARPHAPASHGMCPSCLQKQIAQVAAIRTRAA